MTLGGQMAFSRKKISSTRESGLVQCALGIFLDSQVLILFNKLYYYQINLVIFKNKRQTFENYMSYPNHNGKLSQGTSIKLQKKQKQIYIYAEVDIDKVYMKIVGESKKIRNFVEENRLQPQFIQKLRNYKNLRICFDNQIQKFIHKKQLNPDLKAIKKHVFSALEDFLVKRYGMYMEQQSLHKQYKQKINQIQGHFSKRMSELMKEFD